MDIRTAILVDGAFYRIRAKALFGDKTPSERANELVEYCRRHLRSIHHGERVFLYRIFYYDCQPSNKTIYNPLTQRSLNLKRSPQYQWAQDFFAELAQKRKLALRMGEIQDTNAGFVLNSEATKKLLRGDISVDMLTEHDIHLDNVQQKGVDMRIGLDIASLAQKHLVDQIVLIAGDSDFVPAAKHARREGIDFILDPMWQSIKSSLQLHVDGLITRTGHKGHNYNDRLYIIPEPENE